MSLPTPLTIPGLIASAADRFGDSEALVDGDVRWSFTELAEHVDQAAAALIGTGVESGDRVAVWAPNIWEFVVAALGIHSVGGVLIPVNTRFKGTEAGYLLDKANVRLLFTVTDFLDTDYVSLLADADAGRGLDEIIVMRGAVPDGAVGFDEFIRRADNVAPDVVTARQDAVEPDDLCHIMFTSGTTGLPKGAMLSHGAIVRAYESWASVVGLTHGDRYLIVNPFFHAFGMNAGILACLLKGATIVPHPVFDVPQIMQRVVDEKISMLPGPPAIYQTILNHPDLSTFDLSSLRLAVTGAAPVPVELIAQMRDRLSFETVITGYGLTEVSGIATMCSHDDPPELISATSGKAIADVEVRVVDDAGNEVPRGEPGEIVIRGYNVMQGYLDDPEQTAEAVDADGWMHSGDIGVMNDLGYVDITDRKKDMFIMGGFNCYPAEIENLIGAHPAIAQVAVVGVPDERMGEVGWAFAVAAVDATDVPDESELISWCRDTMANYKVPRRIQFVDTLPMNASNKVLKFELRERALASD